MKQKIRRYSILVLVMAVIFLLIVSVFIYIIRYSENKRISNGIAFERLLHSHMSSNVVGDWTFDDGTLKDATDNENDGIAGKSGPRFHSADSERCFRGGCIEMNAQRNDGFRIPYNLNLSPERMTLSVWVNLSEFLNVHGLIMSEKGDSNWNTTIGHYKQEEDYKSIVPGVVKMYNVDDDGNTRVLQGGELLMHRWYHVVISYSEFGNKKELYVDGEKVGAIDQEKINFYPVVADLLVGEGYANTLDFIGLIDEMRIYDDSIISML